MDICESGDILNMHLQSVGVSKSGPGAFHGALLNKNLPLFLCLLIKN
jgi:hypothetical protein